MRAKRTNSLDQLANCRPLALHVDESLRDHAAPLLRRNPVDQAGQHLTPPFWAAQTRLIDETKRCSHDRTTAPAARKTSADPPPWATAPPAARTPATSAPTRS